MPGVVGLPGQNHTTDRNQDRRHRHSARAARFTTASRESANPSISIANSKVNVTCEMSTH